MRPSRGSLARVAVAAAILAFAATACDTSFYGVLGNKVSAARLAIAPVSTTVPVNGTLTFSASGGAPPYTYSGVSGSGTITASGVYTAPATAGTDTVQVKDRQGTVSLATISVTYVTTNVDYSVTAVTSTGGLVAGAALGGSFTVLNSGTANGSQTITWQAYASPSPTLGGGSTLVASGTTSQLNAGQSAPVLFTGTWPSTAGSYYLIARISATDDPNTANNTLPSTVLAVTPASVDYQVTSIARTGGGTDPASALNGTLQFTNNGPNAGTQYVTWQVYASKVTVLDGTAVLVASGTYAPLAASASSSLIGFSGTWPLTYGNYYLIARVSVPVDVDTNATNNTLTSASTTAVGFYTPSIQNNNVNLSNPNVLPITLQPGMSLSVSASMPGTDLYDIYQFNTGTAASVTFTWSWGSTGATNLYVFNAPSTFIQSVGTTATSLSMLWSPVDAANTNRWIGLNNASGGSLGGYTLIITAN